MLTAEQIKNVKDLKTEEVSVPEWGGSVLVRGLTGYERDSFETSLVESKKKGTKVDMRNMRARLVAMSVVDDKGELVFSPFDVEWLGKKSAAPLDRVFSVAQRLCGMTDEDMEDLEKNLERVTPDGSTLS